MKLSVFMASDLRGIRNCEKEIAESLVELEKGSYGKARYSSTDPQKPYTKPESPTAIKAIELADEVFRTFYPAKTQVKYKNQVGQIIGFGKKSNVAFLSKNQIMDAPIRALKPIVKEREEVLFFDESLRGHILMTVDKVYTQDMSGHLQLLQKEFEQAYQHMNLSWANSAARLIPLNGKALPLDRAVERTVSLTNEQWVRGTVFSLEKN